MNLWDRLTKCDSGRYLNPFLHVFMFLTVLFSVSFLVAGYVPSVQETAMYQKIGEPTAWGAMGLFAALASLASFLIRGRFAVIVMPVCVITGMFVWAWAGAALYVGGYIFQMLAACAPNMIFWFWYYINWNRRRLGRFEAFT